ncbi:hypothetical protein YTPLAS18_31070 [Nitrospira sp.]|nr:hypothetical protein YTPLAS18_31070 [Nitrospira sp.]
MTKAPWRALRLRTTSTIQPSRAASTRVYPRKPKDDHPSIGAETDSIDNTLKAIEKAGGKVVTPKHSIGEWGFMADFADPEGNVMALWEKSKT